MKRINVLITVWYPDNFVLDFGDRYLFGVITEKVNVDGKNAYLCNCSEFKFREWTIKQLVLKARYIEADKNFEKIFNQLENPKEVKAVLFFKGQMWDATSLIEDIIIKAKE